VQLLQQKKNFPRVRFYQDQRFLNMLAENDYWLTAQEKDQGLALKYLPRGCHRHEELALPEKNNL
jgi:hypothetical protein